MLVMTVEQGMKSAGSTCSLSVLGPWVIDTGFHVMYLNLWLRNDNDEASFINPQPANCGGIPLDVTLV